MRHHQNTARVFRCNDGYTVPDWLFLGSENALVTVPVNSLVRYGADGGWVEKYMSGSFTANNKWFGDPKPGVVKAVYLNQGTEKNFTVTCQNTAANVAQWSNLQTCYGTLFLSL